MEPAARVVAEDGEAVTEFDEEVSAWEESGRAGVEEKVRARIVSSC